MSGFITVIGSDVIPEINQTLTPEIVKEIHDQAFSLASQSLTFGLTIGLICGAAVAFCISYAYAKYQGWI
jgi:hypothetical protein